MANAYTSVVSAAVISGDLILGLSDGSLINCGRVQGPVGLTGPEGPMGATGRSGVDGNTILTVAGAPDGSLGKDGDYAINTTVWEIYGPKAGGVWGTGTPLRGNGRGNQSPETTQNLFGSNSGSSGGGGSGKVYNTGNLPNSGPKSVVAGNITPAGSDFTYQQDINDWMFSAFEALDTEIPVKTVGALPAAGEYEGDLVLYNGLLYIWSGGSWVQVGSGVLTITAGDGIEVTSVPGESKISAKLGTGLEFDVNGAIAATGGALQFRGGVDLSDDSDIPAVKNNGDTYANTHDGAISAGWQAVIKEPPAAAQINDLIIWDADDTIFTYVATGGDVAPDPRLPYRLGTDKAIRSADTTATDPSIELVDGEDMFSNVKIIGQGGIITSSDAAAIRIDGSGFLPLTGGTVTGDVNVEAELKVSDDNSFKVEYGNGQSCVQIDPTSNNAFSINKINGDSLFNSKADTVEYQRHVTSISQMGVKEIINTGILDNLMRAPNDGYLKDYLPLAGGTMTGNLAMDGRTISGVGTPTAGGMAMSRNYADGRYVKRDETPGATWDSSFDTNYFCKIGTQGTKVEDGEVMYLDQNGVSTTSPSQVIYIALSLTQFDWDTKCSYSGNIRVKNGAKYAAVYYVWDYSEEPGRHKTLRVTAFDYDNLQRLTEGGTPLSFRGMFLT